MLEEKIISKFVNSDSLYVISSVIDEGLVLLIKCINLFSEM